MNGEQEVGNQPVASMTVHVELRNENEVMRRIEEAVQHAVDEIEGIEMKWDIVIDGAEDESPGRTTGT